jgi:Bacterial Ig-like domain (group 1)
MHRIMNSRTSRVWYLPAIALLVLFGVSSISIPAHALANSINAAYVVDPGHSGCEGYGGNAALGYADPTFDGCSVFVNAVTGSVPVGGLYTTSGGNNVQFTNVPVATIEAGGVGALAAFDTVFTYEVCDFAAHPAYVAALNAYLTLGGNHKLIIYDGDKCSSSAGTGIDPNYSTFLFPFVTNNPGPQGFSGSVTFVETESPPAVLTRNVATGFYGFPIDAVGDSNTFTSNTGGWCAAIVGTNGALVNGIQVAYARTGTGGLAIYNGQDNWATFGHNAFDQQTFDNALDQPFNPDHLPCGVPVTGIKLDPLTATNPVGGSHTVTATVTDSGGNPVAGVTVTFSVTAGPNAGKTGTGVTNAAGQATFTYTDTGGAGTDTLVASFHDATGGLHTSNTVTKIWGTSTTVPEFGAPATLMAAVALLAMTILSKRVRLTRMAPQP